MSDIIRTIQLECFEIDIWDDGDVTIAENNSDTVVIDKNIVDAIHAALHADDEPEKAEPVDERCGNCRYCNFVEPYESGMCHYELPDKRMPVMKSDVACRYYHEKEG